MSRPLPLPTINTVVDDTVAIINADGTVASFTAGTAADPSAIVGNVASGAADAGAPIKIGVKYAYSAAITGETLGDRVDAQGDQYGNLRSVQIGYRNTVAATGGATVILAMDASSNSVGNAAPSAVAGFVWNGSALVPDTLPSAASRIPSSANNTNPTSAKASAGRVHQINGYNSSATVTYLKLYNKASAPTVGTDTPFVTLAIPASQTFQFSFDSLYFTTGIAYGLTTDAADAGTTAVAAGAILGLNVVYS